MPFKDIFIHNQTELKKEIVEIGDYKIGYFVEKSRLRASNENEDSLFLSTKDKMIKFGVADGAGGHPRGKDASFEALSEIKSISTSDFITSIQKANERVIGLKSGSKTTLAFAQIEKDFINFFSIGDSEVIYWNAAGRKLYSSIPHSPTGFKVAAGVSTQEEALSDPDRHYVDSLLGDENVKINATSRFELKKGHTILLGSDGIFDNISHNEMQSIASMGIFEESFEALCKICTEQDEKRWLKDDDISYIYLRKIRS